MVEGTGRNPPCLLLEVEGPKGDSTLRGLVASEENDALFGRDGSFSAKRVGPTTMVEGKGRNPPCLLLGVEGP